MSEPEKPSIVGLSGKIKVLQRKLQHLREQVDTNKFSERSVSYLMAEIYALTAAIQVMQWFAAERPGASGVSPVGVLEAFSELDLDNPNTDDRLYELQEQAKKLVREMA